MYTCRLLNRISISLIITSVLLLLSACTPTVRSEVVVFHENGLPRGQTIRVEPVDTDKIRSLEFRNYAGLIREQLSRIGYVPVEATDTDVELIAELDYSVEPGPVDVRIDRRSPRVHYHFYYGRYYDPFYFGLNNAWAPHIYTTPTYLRKLTMNIIDADTGDRIFEGRVQSEGDHSELPEVMPYLVTALFANFPGESGVTKVVTIERDD